MKFLKQAVAAAFFSFAHVEAKTFTYKEINARVKAGKVDKNTLMKNAIPYKQFLHRNMEDGYYYEQDADDWAEGVYGDNQISDQSYPRLDATSSYSLEFNKCLTLETMNYNLLLDNLISYAKSGTLSSIRNYVLFHVCNGNGNCRKTKKNLYMVDIKTYVEAAFAYGPNDKETTCQACRYNANVCNGGNNRKLEDYYNDFSSNDCAKCDAYDCWYDAEGDQEVDYEAMEAWVSEVSECRETGTQWNNLAQYAGMKCSDDGSGIDIGVFIDPYCRMITKDYSFEAIMSDDDYQYFYQSQDLISMMFSNKIECGSQYQNDDYNDNNMNINSACYGILYGNFVPRALGNCGDKSEEYQSLMNADEYQYQNQQNGNNGQNNMYTQAQQMLYNTYGENIDWYEYDVSAQDLLDGASTCEAVVKKYNSRKHVFVGSGGGFWNVWHNGNTAMQTPSAHLSPVEIAFIIIASMGITALFMHFTRKHLVYKKKKSREIHIASSDKGTPLILS